MLWASCPPNPLAVHVHFHLGFCLSLSLDSNCTLFLNAKWPPLDATLDDVNTGVCGMFFSNLRFCMRMRKFGLKRTLSLSPPWTTKNLDSWACCHTERRVGRRVHCCSWTHTSGEALTQRKTTFFFYQIWVPMGGAPRRTYFTTKWHTQCFKQHCSMQCEADDSAYSLFVQSRPQLKAATTLYNCTTQGGLGAVCRMCTITWGRWPGSNRSSSWVDRRPSFG